MLLAGAVTQSEVLQFPARLLEVLGDRRGQLRRQRGAKFTDGRGEGLDGPPHGSQLDGDGLEVGVQRVLELVDGRIRCRVVVACGHGPAFRRLRLLTVRSPRPPEQSRRSRVQGRQSRPVLLAAAADRTRTAFPIYVARGHMPRPRRAVWLCTGPGLGVIMRPRPPHGHAQQSREGAPNVLFRDRRDAGRRLGERLRGLEAQRPVVLGLTRGGVPVAAEVARALRAPLDVLVVRKLGCPWRPELGVGAIGEQDARVLNGHLIAELGLGADALEAVETRERAELERRVRAYRQGEPPVGLRDRTVLVVDDGVATGSTARAAVEVVRRRGAARVILAVPVAPGPTVDELALVADQVVCLHSSTAFWAVGQFYADFTRSRATASMPPTAPPARSVHQDTSTFSAVSPVSAASTAIRTGSPSRPTRPIIPASTWSSGGAMPAGWVTPSGGAPPRPGRPLRRCVMPTGIMQWFDPRSGEGLVTSRQGDYTVRAHDVEPRARVTGARVRFDRVRVDGSEHAVGVRLRPGSRTSRRHGRFGDLKGAHHPEAKGRLSSLPAPPAREHRPMEVAERWLRAVRTGDVQAAAALYASDAVLYDADGVPTTGPRAVQRWLQRTSGAPAWASAELHGRDSGIEVVWRPRPELGPTTGCLVRVVHGRIAELWDAPRARPTPTSRRPRATG